MVGQLARKEADVAAPITLSYERSFYITLMDLPVFFQQEVVVYHKPEPISMSFEMLTKPFSFSVWLAFAGIVITTVIVFHIAQNILRHQQDRQFKSDCAAYVLRTTLNQGATWSPPYSSSRIIYCFYTLGWLILVSTYTAYLVSFLSVKKEVVPFTTMSELAANNEYNLGTTGGAYIANMLYQTNVSKTSSVHHLRSKLSKDLIVDPSIFTKEPNFHYNRLLTEKYAFFTSLKTYDAFAAKSCKIELLKEKGSMMLDGFAFQKNSAYAKEFDLVVSQIQEGKLDFQIRKEFSPKPKQCSTSFKDISLENIHSVFYILFGGLGVAFACLVGEIMYHCICIWICNQVNKKVVILWHTCKF